MDDEKKKNFINANAPAIMFPYIRAFVTTLTSNIGLGMAPIVIPPHFFKGALEDYQNANASIDPAKY